MSLKWSWYTGGHRDWIAPFFDIAALVSLASYAWRIQALLVEHRQRLADLRSDDERFSTQWLARVLVVLLVSLMLQSGFWLWAVVTGGVNFFEETPLYLALGCAGVYLGVSG